MAREAETKPLSPYEKARKAFDDGLAVGKSDYLAYQSERPSQLQVDLYKWQATRMKPGGGDPVMMRHLGVVEELAESMLSYLLTTVKAGQVAHAILKNKQRIRGYEDEEKLRAEAADGYADMMVFAIQQLTAFRVDWWTLLRETAAEVMERDWTKFPGDGRTK